MNILQKWKGMPNEKKHLLSFALSALGFAVSFTMLLFVPLTDYSDKSKVQSSIVVIAAVLFWLGILCGIVNLVRTIILRKKNKSEDNVFLARHIISSWLSNRRAALFGFLMTSTVCIIAVLIVANIGYVQPLVFLMWILFLSLELFILHSGENDKYTVQISQRIALCVSDLWKRIINPIHQNVELFRLKVPDFRRRNEHFCSKED